MQAEKEAEFKKQMEEISKRQTEQLEAARNAVAETMTKQQKVVLFLLIRKLFVGRASERNGGKRSFVSNRN